MIVYMDWGRRTEAEVRTAAGLPLWVLTVGDGVFARRRGARLLDGLWARGARHCICRDAALEALAGAAGLRPVPVLPLRLALLERLLAVRCPGGLAERAAVLRCGRGGEETARRALEVLARRARCVRLDMERPEALAEELLYRWGVAEGDGGRPVAVTVVCGEAAWPEAGPVVDLTEACGARQALVWTSPRAEGLPVPVGEALAAALTDTGKWKISDIHITDLLDIRRESYYNAT